MKSVVINDRDTENKIMICFVYPTQKNNSWQMGVGSPIRKPAKVSIVDYKDPKNLKFLIPPTLEMGKIADGILKFIKQDFGATKKDIIKEMEFTNQLLNDEVFSKKEYSLYQ